MQKLQCIVGVQNFSFPMFNMRFGMTSEHSIHTPFWQAASTHKYSLYLHMLCMRHALIHVHHLSAKIHQNLSPRIDQVLGFWLCGFVTPEAYGNGLQNIKYTHMRYCMS